MNPGRKPLSRVVFWEPSVSPHKADLIREFSQIAPSWEVLAVADRAIARERVAMGWVAELGGGYAPLVAPDDKTIAKIASVRADETLHVFSGIRWVPSLVRAIECVRAAGARFAIMSEPRATDGWRGAMRVAQSWWTEHWFRRNCEFVLAIGRNGPPWFRLAGYSANRIFPFAYFIGAPAPSAETTAKGGGALRIGFVGRLVREKGIFDLAQACADLRIPYELTFAGDGPERDRLQNDCQRLKVNARQQGVIPIDRISEVLRNLDVVVLASHSKDGWGVAVSEALMVGCSIVTTKKVGASVMIVDQSIGRVVPSRHPRAICDALEAIHSDGTLGPAGRKKRSAYALRTLTGRAGAAYLLEIVRWCEGRSARPAPFFLEPTQAPS